MGGVHGAVPGYIKLDTIKPALASGEKYPIDIFFCERNLNQSNIRITTNMYFAQTAADGTEAGLFLQTAGAGKEICLREASANTCAALTGTANTEPICGSQLAPRLSYSLVVPGIIDINLNSDTSGCVWPSPTNGVCYGGIVLNNGVVSIDENAVPEYLKILGFELHASVAGYSSLNVYKMEAVASIAKISPMLRTQEPAYYSLKGEPLGKQKPKRAGVYIVRQNGVNRIEVVR